MTHSFSYAQAATGDPSRKHSAAAPTENAILHQAHWCASGVTEKDNPGREMRVS